MKLETRNSDSIVIRCEGLSKQYRIGERESYRALRDVITDAASAPFRRLRSAARNGSSRGADSWLVDHHSSITNTIWALDDVSFEVKRGEVLGIIGRNGAGKSTLLKILSRITKPTRGHAEIHGRVGSLLEVGTGFHPELTGRENIYLNAAILGMRKGEIERKFDEMVTFAEVEKFVDTPVKRYSSGMYVRLAFAVAAHMETEVLLVDEVLAVGDAEFQKKCLSKMHDISVAGRTVLFVSHNMAAMRSLCSEVLYLDNGKIVRRGDPAVVIDSYLAAITDNLSGRQLETKNIFIDSVLTYASKPSEGIVPLGAATIHIKCRSKREVRDLSIRLMIEDGEGLCLMGIDSWTIQEGTPCLPNEPKTIDVTFPALPLAPGEYRVKLFFHSYLQDIWEESPTLFPLIVREAAIEGCRNYDRRVHGLVATKMHVHVA